MRILYPTIGRMAKKMSRHVQVVILLFCFCVPGVLQLFFSEEGLVFRYNAALFFLGLMLILLFLLPDVRGQSIGYPLPVISLIWFLIYGIGSRAWLLEAPENAILVVYSSGFSLIFLSLGYLLGGAVASSRKQKGTLVNVEGLKRRAWLFCLLSFVATAYFIVVGGIPAFHPSALTYRFEVREQVSSYVVFLLRASQLPLYVLWALFLLGYIKYSFRNCLVVFFCIALVLFVNFIPGWRNPLMFIVFNLIFIYVFLGSAIGRFWAMVIGGSTAFLILVMGFVRLLRLSETRAVDSISYFSQFTTDPLQMFFLWSSAQFSNYTLGFLTSLSVFPDLVGHLKGGVLITTLATMLPGRQELLDEKLKRWSGMEFDGGGLNLTILGEAYADFGLFGIAFYPLLYGVVLGFVVRRVEISPTPARAIIAAFTASAICLGSLTGLLALSSFWVIGGFLVFISLGEKKVRTTS